VNVALMLEHMAQWASAVARLLLLPSGVVTTDQTHELSVCRVIVRLGLLAWKLKQLAGSCNFLSYLTKNTGAIVVTLHKDTHILYYLLYF